MASFPGASLFGKKSYKLYAMVAKNLDLLPGLKIKSAEIKNSALVATHPTEDGMALSDNKVIMPREITVEAYCKDKATYEMLYGFFVERILLMGIRVKEITVENVTMSELTPIRDPKVLSAIPVRFTLIEIMKINVETTNKSTKDVAKKQDSSTVQSGQKQGLQPDPNTARQYAASAIGKNS